MLLIFSFSTTDVEGKNTSHRINKVPLVGKKFIELRETSNGMQIYFVPFKGTAKIKLDPFVDNVLQYGTWAKPKIIRIKKRIFVELKGWTHAVGRTPQYQDFYWTILEYTKGSTFKPVLHSQWISRRAMTQKNKKAPSLAIAEKNNRIEFRMNKKKFLPNKTLPIIHFQEKS